MQNAMNNLKLKDITVEKDGIAHPAVQAECCPDAGFAIFQVNTQSHFHLACLACGTTYCSADHDCEGRV